jgi:hypothetical protein
MAQTPYLPFDSTYSKNGLTVTYPSDWKIEEGISKYNVVTFLAPSTNSLNLADAAIAIYMQKLPDITLSNYTLASDTNMLDLYSFAQIAYINKTFGITDISGLSLMGLPAYQIDFSTNGLNATCLWTVAQGYVYVIVYIANNDVYQSYYHVFWKCSQTLRSEEMIEKKINDLLEKEKEKWLASP